MFSTPAAGTLTVLFLLTSAYCAVRWSHSTSSGNPAQTRVERVVDANQLVMGVAMLAMIWWPFGRVGNTAQAVFFGAFAALLAGWALRARQHRLGLAAHAVCNAAMAWMVGAMHLLMPSGGDAGTSSGGSGGHAGHGSGGGMGGMNGMPMTTPDWVGPVNGVAVAASLAAAGFWLVSLFRDRTDRAHALCHAGMSLGMAAMLVLMRQP